VNKKKLGFYVGGWVVMMIAILLFILVGIALAQDSFIVAVVAFTLGSVLNFGSFMLMNKSSGMDDRQFPGPPNEPGQDHVVKKVPEAQDIQRQVSENLRVFSMRALQSKDKGT